MSEEEGAQQLREVCELAAHVIPRLNHRLRPKDSELGLGMLSALFALESHGPRRSGDLAHLEGVAAPTMTRMMAGLGERGYVERRPDPDDGRACLMEVTEAGREALVRARRDYAERIQTVFQELDPAELGTVGKALRALLGTGLIS